MRSSLIVGFLAILFVVFAALSCSAQQSVMPGVPASSQSNEDINMPGMDHQTGEMSGMHASQDDMAMESHSLIDVIRQHAASGTDAEPNSTPFEMLMAAKGQWTFMFHAQAFLSDIQQTGPRGGDKLFSTNWMMPMAQRRMAGGTLTLRAMLSLEPVTISQRRYPELFQLGETAYALPIVDGQHPHNLFMELAALYDYRVGERTYLSFYAAPVGDPALGPPAYPHRSSASEDPVAPLGHHLQDSTHIAADVVTLGMTHGNFRLEASGFHGREPGEDRFHIDSGGIDSWSTRLTINLSQDWSFQYSIGQLHSPESLFPGEDIRRMTSSLMYNRRIHKGDWSAMALWGRNQSLADDNVGNSYLLESTINFVHRNYAWTRIENVDRTNELLLGENPLPVGFTERYFTRVQAYTGGYDREVGRMSHLSTMIGAQVTWYGVPEILKATYGARPMAAVMFFRIRPK